MITISKQFSISCLVLKDIQVSLKRSATFSKPDFVQLSDSGEIGLLLIVMAGLLNSLRVKSSETLLMSILIKSYQIESRFE